MKDWIYKGIYQIKDILDDQNNLIPFQDLENLADRAPHRLLECNAVNTTLRQARQHNGLHLRNNPSEEDSPKVTLNDKAVISFSVKDFRQLLTKDMTNRARWASGEKKLDTEIDNRSLEAAFNANQETRLKVHQWKIPHKIYPTNILLHKTGITNSETCNACHSVQLDYREHTWEKINPTWQLVNKEILFPTGGNITVSLDTTLLSHPGWAGLTPNILTINCLVTLAKMCIRNIAMPTPSQ